MARSKNTTVAELLRCLETPAAVPEQLPSDALVAVCVQDAAHFALTVLALLESGQTPVLQPSAAECAAFDIPAIVTDLGVERRPAARSSLVAEPGSYYAFSSGTTGTRKPLRFSQARGLANARAHAQSLGLGPEHRLLQTLPLHHAFGIVAYLFTPLVSGARVALGTYVDALFSSPGQQLARTVLHLTPEHLRLLRRRNVTLPAKLAKLSVGAAPLRREDAAYALTLCHELYTTYGLSEAGPRVTTGRVQLERFVDGWIGFPLQGIQARVAADGELSIRSPYAMNEEFFSTGDRVQRLEDGSLVFCNRCADVLRLRGQTHPREAYNRKLEDLLGVACEVTQRRFSDELLIYVECTTPLPDVAGRIARAFPELREARVCQVENFARGVLGKPDIAAMLAQTGED